MKKLFLFLVIIMAGIAVNAQTPAELYSPKILEQTFTYDNGDNGLRQVYQSQKNLDSKNWTFNFTMVEYRNSIRAETQCWKDVVTLPHVDTLTNVFYNGNYYTNSVFWFSRQIVTMPLPLFTAIGIHLYYQRVDPDSLFIKP